MLTAVRSGIPLTRTKIMFVFCLAFQDPPPANMLCDMQEELIGKWFVRTGKRKDIFLATKFGLADPLRFPNADPAYVKTAIKNSLKKLQTDYIDLYYLHRWVSSLLYSLSDNALLTKVFLAPQRRSPSAHREDHRRHGRTRQKGYGEAHRRL